MESLREPQDPAEALALVRRYLEATYRIAEATLGCPDLQSLYAEVHATVRNLMPAENFYLALWDRASGTVSFPYWADERDPAPAPRALRRGLTEFVLRTGEPLLLEDELLARLKAAGEVEAIGTDSLAWLGVPLVGDQGVSGALVVQIYRGDRRYTPEERDLLVFVSRQVAMAIGYARDLSTRQAAERALRASEEKFSKAFQASPDAININRGDGTYLEVNDAFTRMSGWTREEALGRTTLELGLWADPEDRTRMVELLRAHGAFSGLEAAFRMKDGSLRHGLVSGALIQVQGETCLLSITRDITDRRDAEIALRQSEDKFSRAFHASPDAINLTRLDDGTYLDVSHGFEELSGWTKAEVVGRSALDLGIWADPEDRRQVVDLIRACGQFTGYEATFRRKDGSTLTGLMSGRVMEMDGIPCLLSVTRNISGRKQAEQALRTAEMRLRTVLSNTQAIIYQLDPEGRFTLSEGLGLAKLGLVPGQMVGQSALELYGADPGTLDQLRRSLAGQGSSEVTRVGGRVFDNSLTPVLDDQGRIECVIGIATDITERDLAEEALRAERSLFVGGPVMVVRWQADSPWNVDYISPNARELLGYAPEDFTSGRVLFDELLHPEDRGRIHEEAQRLRARGSKHYEQQYRIRNAEGSYRWFQDFTTMAESESLAPYYLGYMLDVTERREAETTLRQSQKLESLGVLAGGIAHDFNNLLTVIMGNLNLAQIQLGPDSTASGYLANMEATVLRATELTKQMLAYSGRGHFIVKPHDLNQVVKEMAHLLEVSIPKKARLRFDLQPDLPAIQADPAQLQQVVMNLVTNASDAIGEAEGAILLSTSTEVLDDRELRSAYRVQEPMAGPHVLLEVRDTGMGMSEEVQSRIFDPFFSTKAKGRGLGLSAMLGILRGHKAGIQIHSEPGRGSTFRLCFPACAAPVEAPQAQAPAGASQRLSGRVLVVDDEEALLATVKTALEALGMEVHTAGDGVEALEQFRSLRSGLSLVLMDLTMPRLDGREAFQAMHDLDPAIPVLLTSGFTRQDSLKTLSGIEPAGFIQKPYQIDTLRQAIAQVLAGS